MKMPEGAIRSFDEVKDKYARIRFIKGEPILLDKLTDTKGNLTGSIPPGFRVMSVKVDEADVMRGIAPGDKVDVNLYVKRSEEISEPGTYTIMQAVRVFSVGAKIEKDIDPKGQESQFRTISLLVTPEQVRDLAGAVQIGKLSFTLRNSNEPINDETGVTKLNDILKGTTTDSGATEVATTPSAPAPAPAPTGPSLLEQFASALKNAKPPQQAETEPQTGYTMHIYTPNEVKQFQWQSREGTPQESTVFSAAGSSGSSAPPSAAPAAAGTGPSHRPGYLLERRPFWMTETPR
jgi:pilus assembly protein CpaB